VHKRAARNTNGGVLPEPRIKSAYKVTEFNLGEFETLVSTDNHRSALKVLPLVDQGVLTQVVALGNRSFHWKKVVGMDLNLILTARKTAPYIEARMRRLLGIAPLVDELDLLNQHLFSDLHKIMNASFVMQFRFHEHSGIGSVEEWDSDSDIKARGCIIAMAACSQKLLASDFGRETFFEDDAIWLGTHSEALLPLMPLLAERGLHTREGVEPLLKSAAPALTEGIL
jgi:hypothetical protein